MCEDVNIMLMTLHFTMLTGCEPVEVGCEPVEAFTQISTVHFISESGKFNNGVLKILVDL